MRLGIRAEFIELVPRKSKNAVKVNTQRVDDFGNYQLISAYAGEVPVKVKVKRKIAVPGEEA